jgi:hypothetical protein
MDTLKIRLKGSAPTIMQCDRLVNPFDALTRSLKTLTAKRKKTDADLEEISRLKFLGSLYFDAKVGPYWPGQNIDRMIFDAAKLSRRGQDIKRAFMVLDDMVPLIYDGPRTPEKLYADARFVDIRSVVIRGQRVMTCRPIFRDWEVEYEAAFDPDVLNKDDVVAFHSTAGQFIGLSTYRPRFGRFGVKAVDGVVYLGEPRLAAE